MSEMPSYLIEVSEKVSIWYFNHELCVTLSNF
jgi:hypothetical protein